MIGPTPSTVLLDALLLATFAATGLVGFALLVADRPKRSGCVRKHLVGAAVVAAVGTFAIAAAAAPGPVGCLAARCATDAGPAKRAERALFAGTAGAAGKFADVVPLPEVSAAETRAPGLAPPALMALIWVAGVLVSLGRVARRRRLAARLVRRARPVRDRRLLAHQAAVQERLGIRSRVALLHHPGLPSPVIAGALRPALLLPSGPDGEPAMAPAEAEIVFLHELAHVRRRDALATLAYEAAAALFWFHPFVARAARRIRELQEVAADSDVLRGGIRASEYAAFLLAAFRRLAPEGRASLVDHHAIAGECIMETRLRAILDPEARHDPPRPRFAVGAMAGAMLLGAAIASTPMALQATGVLQGRQAPDGLREEVLRPDAIDSILRPVIIDHMAARYIAGAAVTVVSGGELVYAEGFGRREVYQEDPVDVDRTIWRIGSITKVLTGVAVLQLVDEGLLDLDEDVNAYFDVPIVPRDRPEPVRVWHLLTHTAGFDQVGLGRHEDGPGDVRPLEDFLRDYLARIRDPGVLSTYDTYGITLAGLLVERLSGTSYAEYLERKIFAPLDMHRSGIAVPPALAGDVAVGYGFAGHWEAARWEHMNTAPASSVNASAPDMANLMRMLLNGGVFGGERILSEASAERMLRTEFTNHPDQPGYSLTLWEDRSYGVAAFSHGGSMTGYGAFLYLVPDHDLGIFVAYNQESGSLAERVLSSLVDAAFPGRSAPELRPRFEGPIDVDRFVGTYANSLYHHADPDTGWRRAPFELRADAEGRLVFQEAPARAVGPLSFQREDGLLLTFLESPAGEITHLLVNQTVFERLE